MRTWGWSRWTAPRSSRKVREYPVPSMASWAQGLNLRTARLFNTSPIQPRRCRVLLTKIALLLYTGEKFPTNEATTLFFGISKLFQNKDASLRQMVHLVTKELARSAEDIIMVTSTIMKDTGGSTDAIYRPNAIRALCRIIDVRSSPASISQAQLTALSRPRPSSRSSV